MMVKSLKYREINYVKIDDEKNENTDYLLV